MKKLLFLFLILLFGAGCEKPMGAVPDNLKVKVKQEDIIGQTEKNGVVKYAYKKSALIDEKDNIMVLHEQKTGVHITTEDISKRGDSIRVFNTTDPKVKVAKIDGGDPNYWKDKDGNWWNVSYATTTQEVYDLSMNTVKNLWGLIPLAQALTTTTYPAKGKNSPVDGFVSKTNDSNWANTCTASAGNEKDDIGADLDNIAVTGFFVARTIMLYDVSSITGVTVSDVTFSGYINASLLDANGTFVRISSSNPASNSILAFGDFPSISTTAFATDINLSAMTANVYSTWTFNALGISYVQTAMDEDGIIKLGSRIGMDVTCGVAPTGLNRANFNSADATSNHPYLVITYTINPSVAPKPDDGFLIFE